MSDKYKSINEMVADAAQTWKRSITRGDIESMVSAALEQELKKTILALAGFTERYGRMELNHTNGRINSVDRWIRENAAQYVHDWIIKNISDLPEMTEEMEKQIYTEYKNQYSRYLRELIKKKAEEHAIDAVESLSIDRIEKIAREVLDEKKEPQPDKWTK